MIPFFRKNWLLILIISIPTLLTLFGLTYTLPMHVIGDEESLAGGAYKMLELRTIAPAQYPAEFDFFYYPPIIGYLIIIFSLPAMAFQFAAQGFSLGALQDFFALDQNLVWISGRFAVLVFSVLMLLVTYDLAKQMTNRRTALIATALLASSFFHNNLAHWIKHWIFATFFAYLSFLLMYRYVNGQLKWRYAPAVAAALGAGTSYISALGVIIAGVYGLVKRKMIPRFGQFVLISAIIGLVLGGGLVLLNYPELYKIFGPEDGSLEEAKSFSGLFSVLWYALRTYVFQELIISLLAVLGLLFVARRRVMNAYIFGATILYLAILYLFFHIELRYVYFTLPALVIAGAAFVDWLLEKISSRNVQMAALLLIFVWPVLTGLQYHRLVYALDTREQATAFLQVNANQIPFVISSEFIRLPRTAQSLEAAQGFGRINAPERYFLANKDRLNDFEPVRYQYQNLHFWNNEKTIEDLEKFISEENPVYFVVEYWHEDDLTELDKYLIEKGRLVKEYRQSRFDAHYQINGNFFVSNSVLFTLDRLGPAIDVYALN